MNSCPLILEDKLTTQNQYCSLRILPVCSAVDYWILTRSLGRFKDFNVVFRGFPLLLRRWLDGILVEKAISSPRWLPYPTSVFIATSVYWFMRKR